jgi:hypothetical protein
MVLLVNFVDQHLLAAVVAAVAHQHQIKVVQL